MHRRGVLFSHPNMSTVIPLVTCHSWTPSLEESQLCLCCCGAYFS